MNSKIDQEKLPKLKFKEKKRMKKSNPEIEYPKTVERLLSCTICAIGTPEETETGA